MTIDDGSNSCPFLVQTWFTRYLFILFNVFPYVHDWMLDNNPQVVGESEKQITRIFTAGEILEWENLFCTLDMPQLS